MTNAEQELLTLEALAGAPLTFNYFLAPGIDFQTTVTGENRDNATVAIIFTNTPMWMGTLTPGLPSEKFPTLSLGDLTITEGQVSLTPPTSSTEGFVLLTCTIKRRGQEPVPFSGIISKWPLSRASV